MPKYRLMFWVGNNLVSKFVFAAIPRIDEMWTVPKGSHKYNSEQGRITVKVIGLKISPSFDPGATTDVNLSCDLVKD